MQLSRSENVASWLVSQRVSLRFNKTANHEGHILIKTLLNRVHPLQSFVYGKVSVVNNGLVVAIVPRKKSRPVCSGCGVPGATYDTARSSRNFDLSKEAKAMHAEGYQPVLSKSRWSFLKRKENLTPSQSDKLTDVLQYNLKTVRTYLLKEAFEAFWTYTSPSWAAWFLDAWCTRAMRSGLEPIKDFAKTCATTKSCC